MRRDLLASREELRRLRDRIARKPFDAIYETLHSRCGLILESHPVTENQWRLMSQQGSWAAGLVAARTTQGRIFDLLIAHHIDPNPAFRDRAIEELKNLISWSAWTDPSFGDLPADLLTAEAGVAAAVGLDWLWEDLTEPDRLRVLRALRTKVIAPYRQGVERQAFWYNCYHNWNAVVNSGCGLAAMCLSDEEPAAREAYRAARAGLKYFFDSLGREGGWDEGLAYWGYAMRYVLLLGEASSRLLDDEKIYHSRGMDATGLFPIYFTPRGQPVNFGDSNTAPLYGALYLLVKRYGLKDLTWWLDSYAFHRDVAVTGWSSAGLALLFRPVDAEPSDGAGLPPVKVFNEIGWAAMADHWPHPSFYVAAKTGDLAANHSQRDMNSLQLVVDGEKVLTDIEPTAHSREYYLTARESFYEVQARAHNTVLVGERDHRIDAQGTIIEAQAGNDFRWLSCDAQQACGGGAHFFRHAVMVVQPKTGQGRMLIVVDELAGAVAEKIELFWHTTGELELANGKAAGVLRAGHVAVPFAVGANVKFTIAAESRALSPRKTDQFVHVTAQAAKAVFVSVFSREKISGRIELKPGAHGALRVKVDGVTLHFKSLRHHLQLESVDS